MAKKSSRERDGRERTSAKPAPPRKGLGGLVDTADTYLRYSKAKAREATPEEREATDVAGGIMLMLVAVGPLIYYYFFGSAASIRSTPCSVTAIARFVSVSVEAIARSISVLVCLLTRASTASSLPAAS